MAVVRTDELISITEANRLGVSGLVREAEEGHAASLAAVMLQLSELSRAAKREKRRRK